MTRRATARGTEPPGPWLTIVGVVPDILQDDESFELAPVLYFPFHQRPENGMEVPDPDAHPRRDARKRHPHQSCTPSMRISRCRAFGRWRNRCGCATGDTASSEPCSDLSAIALLLASVGLYAVVSHSVSQRTREIGVRIALGAAARDILGLIFRHGMLQICVGLTIGLAAAAGVTRVLSALLVGVDAVDPLTFAVVTVLLASAGALGCAVPARRATRVDPLVALRSEYVPVTGPRIAASRM